jgi:hypothetical protein
MTPFLDLFGFKEGKRMNYAIPMDVVGQSNVSKISDADAARLREEATKTLSNIGTEERERRAQAAKVFGIITALYSVWAALIADDGGLSGHILRFLSIIPLFFTVGYKLSVCAVQ